MMPVPAERQGLFAISLMIIHLHNSEKKVVAL
jgi:hypothetical protein